MAGLSSTLNIASSALKAQSYGLNVTGNNISNVNNDDYSIQSAQHTTTASLAYGGYILGTGVNVEQVEQSVDQLLENRLTAEKAGLAAYTEAESYVLILEGYFNESSDSSMTSALNDFWNSWHDLADNPLGSAERGIVYEQGNLLADRFNTLASDLDTLSEDLTNEIAAGVNDVNDLAAEIAQLNYDIKRLETSGTANDLRDQRNGLIDELAEMIDIDIIEEGDGDLLINVANGAPLVNGMDYYELTMKEDQIIWGGVSGADSGYAQDITDRITAGKIGGWLDVRDEIIPEYRSELDELAYEMIWAMNLQQSQGAGLTYFNESLAGSYSVDESGWLSSLDYGKKIDYTGDVTVWIEDMSEAETAYRRVMVDMGISTAAPTHWEGTALEEDAVRYELTVVDEGDIGEKTVTEVSGDYFAGVYSTSSGDASTVVDNILADQTITFYNTDDGTQTIEIADSGGDAVKSAAEIAAAMSEIDGVAAYASETSALFDLSSNAQDGDEVKYTLYVDGYTHEQSFMVDSDAGSLDEQFEDSLVEAVQDINELNDDDDLYADGLSIYSDKGATLGVQAFEVQDNAAVKLDTFTNFDNTDTVTWTIATDGVPTTATTVSVDLTNIDDTTDQDEMASAFYNALSDALPEDTFTVERDGDSVVLRTLDGSNVTLSGAFGDNDATVNLSPLSGTSLSGAGDSVLTFDGADSETFDSDTDLTDTLGFSTVSGDFATTVTASGFTGAGVTTAAAIMGTVTIVTDEGIEIQSDTRAANGLFGTSGNAVTGSSIMTLGGEGGFGDWTEGETVSFDVDGMTVDIAIPVGTTSDYDLASLLMIELASDIGTTAGYSFIQNGASVSIIKNEDSEDPIEITNFRETGDNDATLAVSTGSGNGAEDPENGILDASSSYRNFATSSLNDNDAQIYWKKLDADGNHTGDYGLVTVTKEGTVEIEEDGYTTLSFQISEGLLVAGNTLTINTDENGEPDPLDFTVTGEGNSVNDIYTFEVVSGGTVGHEPEDGEENLTIQWSNGVTSGGFEIEGDDPPKTPETPVELTVDGMTLSFYDGTLFEGDVFTITTDETGTPVSTNENGKATGETMSDWHWTLDSFADQFNREAGGLTASVNSHNQLEIGASETYHVIEDIEYSGRNGFSEDNISIEVRNWDALDFNASDLQFNRDANGTWGVLNDATGGQLQLIPEGGDDNGFEVDVNGDGVGDISIEFSKEISGEGYVQFDLVSRKSSDINFAFGDDSATESGLMAALGINTLFEGSQAYDMASNDLMANTDYIGAGFIDSETGEIVEGSNENANAFGELQYESMTMKEWNYERGEDATSSLTDATLNDYYTNMVSSLGLDSSNIQGAKEYAQIMVNQLTEQRNSVSAVSLDEEMVNLIKYQQAYSAASKLLTTADEMLDTLLSIR